MSFTVLVVAVHIVRPYIYISRVIIYNNKKETYQGARDVLVSSPFHPYCTNAFSVNSISNKDYLCIVISIVLKNNETKNKKTHLVVKTQQSCLKPLFIPSLHLPSLLLLRSPFKGIGHLNTS